MPLLMQLLVGFGLGWAIRSFQEKLARPASDQAPAQGGPPETLPVDYQALDSSIPMFPSERPGMSACPPGYVFGDAAEIDRKTRGPICMRADVAERVRRFVPHGRR